MLRNYLLIALRNFKRQKLFSLLNMFGLALGLGSAIFIFLYVSDELCYDVMHPNYKNSYRIGCTFTNRDGQTFDNTEVPGAFVKYLKDNRSEVTHASRITYVGYPTSLNYEAKDKIILTEEIRWAEPNFQEVLAFDPVEGNRQKMFENPNSMVVSETGAKKLFGKEDPVGKIISVKHRWATEDREIDVMVTGVYKDYPSNSHFKPQFILNVNAFRTIYGDNFNYFMEGTSFGGNRNLGFFESYVSLKPGADIRPIKMGLDKLANQMISSDSASAANGWKLSSFLTKMTDLHFDKKNLWEGTNIRGDRTYLTIFSIIAILIMLIACINYMNLATARSVKRAKEVGLRKSFGSDRAGIAKQFFLESFLMIMSSLIMAVLLVILFLHPFNQLAHKTFTLGSLINPVMIAIIFSIVLFMGFISGIYPAFYLSAFQAVEVLKGQIVKGKSAEFFRKSLVAVQYTVALVLIICTFIVIKQMEQLKTTKLNEQGSQILSIRFGGIAQQERFAEFKRSVLEDPQIEYVTMGNHLPRLNYFGWIGTDVKFPEFGDKKLQWNQLNVEFDFAKAFKLQFIAGRDFQTGNLNDSNSMIINEAGIKALNQPINKVMGATVNEIRFDTTLQYRIIGVVKDFPYRSMHQPIEPLLLNPHLHFIDKIAYIKLPSGKFGEKIASIEKKWKAVFPNTGFDHWFLNDEFNRMYIVEGRVSSLAKSFAVLAILITVLGVFGLASYTAEQRTKEVGIRKVLGASERQVISMFLRLFFKIFAVACLAAIPVAWFAAYKWLQSFAYRTSISPVVFAISLLGLLGVTLLTVGYEILKSARSNPVTSLRTE
ncbi:MAG TPA: FtsX-like permease family protein [Chitinophagaceae bacterium]|jgi:putative ABC transport system permease protein|nr:FtsX-like permease family protein [Chitinophagaceae bacterium]